MSWFRIVNATKNKARIDIYDDIGEFTDWWTGEKTGLAARDFSAALTALDVSEIELHINSRGGSVPDGIQIYNELRRHKASVTVVIDGQAASIASIILMICSRGFAPTSSHLS
jgi:ATP-dependent protease ClpP protease subunit